MMRAIWIFVGAAPFALAWILTGNLCGHWLPDTAVCAHASDMFFDVFISFSIMFCIAIWVGALFCYLLLKYRHPKEGSGS